MLALTRNFILSKRRISGLPLNDQQLAKITRRALLLHDRSKKADLIIKPLSQLKVPIEIAPWRHPDEIHVSPKIKLGL